MNKEKMQDIKERLDLFPSNMNEPAQKAYCELFDYIANLEQQCKKQRKVIDDCKEEISNLLNIINENYNELKCTSDEWDYINSILSSIGGKE